MMNLGKVLLTEIENDDGKLSIWNLLKKIPGASI
jgi:hypothetical protein